MLENMELEGKGGGGSWVMELSVDDNICIYHGLRNLFFGVLHGMLFCCFISGRLYIFELFSVIFIRVLRPSLRPQNYVRC